MGDILYSTSPPSLMGVSPAYWNYSDHVNLENIKMDSNFMWLLCSLVSAISWLTYITYYNSRVLGYILTKLLNRFVGKYQYIKVGEYLNSTFQGLL